jgi:Rieske Fe-S protein
MNPSRRDMVAVAAAAGATVVVAACGCGPSAGERAAAQPAIAKGPVDAGPYLDLVRNKGGGIDDRFAASHGFFIVTDTRLYAMSATCTHRRCPLKRSGEGIKCHCHGSTFTNKGEVTRGPASRQLPRFRVTLDAHDHVIVHTERPLVMPEQFDEDDAFIGIVFADANSAATDQTARQTRCCSA